MIRCIRNKVINRYTVRIMGILFSLFLRSDTLFSSNPMVCIIDTSKTVPFSEPLPPTTTISYIPVTSHPFSKNDDARLNDVRMNVKPPQVKHRRQRKKDKVTLPCGSFLISLNVSMAHSYNTDLISKDASHSLYLHS
jgi:hypothetical protein